MALKAWSSTASSAAALVIACAATAATVAAAEAPAPHDVQINAQVDKTAVELGQTVTLTITLAGDLAGIELPPPQFPEGIAVAARSQSTSIAIRAGRQERSTGLQYVLVPQQAGTFTLGPFSVTHGKETLETPSITLTVTKSALPPGLRRQPDGTRYTL